MKNVHDPDNCPPKMRLKTHKSIHSSSMNLFLKTNNLVCREAEPINIVKVVDHGDDENLPNLGGRKYYINNSLYSNLILYRGKTYVFDLSDDTNGTHPLWFHVGRLKGSDQVGGQTATYFNSKTGAQGTGAEAGRPGAKLTFVVPDDAPDVVYYVCSNHANMGMGSFAVKTLEKQNTKHGSYKRYLMNRVGKEHVKNKYNVNNNKFEKDCGN